VVALRVTQIADEFVSDKALSFIWPIERLIVCCKFISTKVRSPDTSMAESFFIVLGFEN
jgi:hypothetical protein